MWKYETTVTKVFDEDTYGYQWYMYEEKPEVIDDKTPWNVAEILMG